ncbi:MAG: hypothetical protein M1834_007519 [Cirrosporium novae-zelandiae]|nr:MAG: hypothetical protein M1834_007519 [Cirrosporium novae-zelandiae]
MSESHSPSTVKEPTGFMTLPPEVRLMIYELVLVHPHCIPLKPSYFCDRCVINLLHVNSTIRREALPIFFDKNTFGVDLHYSVTFLLLPPHIRPQFQHLEIKINPFEKGWECDIEIFFRECRNVTSMVFSMDPKRNKGSGLRRYLQSEYARNVETSVQDWSQFALHIEKPTGVMEDCG